MDSGLKAVCCVALFVVDVAYVIYDAHTVLMIITGK